MEEMLKTLELDAIKQQISRYASFSLGKVYIREIQPHFEKLWLERELKRSDEAIQLVYRYGSMPFYGMKDVREAIEDARKNRILSPRDLKDIADSIRSVEHVDSYMKQSEIETPLIKELVSSFSHQVQLATTIEKAISNAYEVVDQASPLLKSIRKKINSLHGQIASEAQKFISKHHHQLMDSITTQRNDRTCVLVKISEKNSIDGLLHGESASGQTAYIEPRSLMILNNTLQSEKVKEKEEIERILYELSQLVKKCAYELIGNIETFGLLDMIFAKAQWAKAFDGCIATINMDHELYIKDARHPLIDQDHVVANTYQLRQPKRILMISGSNTGGKTITLKTIGLFVLMTMCGMPIAASVASIPMVTNIFVNIGDNQSILESLSTFSSHITQLANIVDHSDEDSLVLLDELGSGTDPKEGEPLAIAILQYLRKKHCMVISTTHYSSLKRFASGKEDILLASVAFDQESLAPTYRYIEGISGQSNALLIARRYGLKKEIVNHAINLKKKHQSEEEHLMEHLEKMKLEIEEEKMQLEATLSKNIELNKQLEKEKRDLQNKSDRILEEYRQKQEKELQDKLDEADEIIQLLKEKDIEAKPHEITELKSQLDHLNDTQDEEEDIIQEEIHVGDYVTIRHLNYHGEVLSINKDQVVVFANGMKMSTKMNNLIKEHKQKQKKVKTSSYAKSKITSFSMECNVIGMRVHEALEVIDKYLDNAVLAKATSVRLVHGMGTGKLRKGIHDYLKRNPRVESYTMGGQGEGGLGATIVTLKQKGKK